MDDNDTSWPTAEPEKWRGFDIKLRDLKAIADVVENETGAYVDLVAALDDAAGLAEGGEAYLLIRIGDRR